MNDLKVNDLVLHIKTGNIYIYLGDALLESTKEPYARYQRCVSHGDRPVWIRPKSEFIDGRFVKINTKELNCDPKIYRSSVPINTTTTLRNDPSGDEIPVVPEKYRATVRFNNSYYGEDSGESKYILEGKSKEALKESVRKLVNETCNVYSVDYGLPIRSCSLYKIEYSWGETAYSLF